MATYTFGKMTQDAASISKLIAAAPKAGRKQDETLASAVSELISAALQGVASNKPWAIAVPSAEEKSAKALRGATYRELRERREDAIRGLNANPNNDAAKRTLAALGAIKLHGVKRDAVNGTFIVAMTPAS